MTLNQIVGQKPPLNFMCSNPSLESSSTNHDEDRLQQIKDTDTEDYLLDDPAGTTISSSSSLGYHHTFMMDTTHGFHDNDDDEDDEEDSDAGMTMGGVTKKRNSGKGAKRKRSAFSKAAQISERLQSESISGTFADEDIQWDPNNGLPHAGKWPIEEERFAYMLIRNFENGTLDDCDDGTTLRSYLAKTLQCAPMRVSKKFAGKCIGSKTFVRRHGEENHYSLDPTSGGGNDVMLGDGLSSSMVTHGGHMTSGSTWDRKLTIHAPRLVVPNKYGLRKNAVRSYDEYDDEYNDDEASSTSGEDLNDASSGSSSDGGASDGSGSPPPSNCHSRNKRQRSNNMDMTNVLVRNVTSSPLRRKPSYPQSSSTRDYMHSFGSSSTNCDTGIFDPDHDEWGQALSYFCAADFCGINGGLKRTQSTISFSLLG